MIRNFIKECMFFQTDDTYNIVSGIVMWLIIPLYVVGVIIIFNISL